MILAGRWFTQHQEQGIFFNPMQVEVFSAILVENTPPTAYDKAYYEVFDSVIPSFAVVLEFLPSVEDTVVPNAIQSQVASVRSVYDPEMFVNNFN